MDKIINRSLELFIYMKGRREEGDQMIFIFAGTSQPLSSISYGVKTSSSFQESIQLSTTLENQKSPSFLIKE